MKLEGEKVGLWNRMKRNSRLQNSVHNVEVQGMLSKQSSAVTVVNSFEMSG